MSHLDDFTLNEYLDDALDETTRVDTETHLQACEACQAKLDDLRSLFADLEALPEVQLDHDLAPTILARLPESEPVRSKVWTRAFAVQVGIIVGFVFWLGLQVTPLIRVPQLVLPEPPSIEIQSIFIRLLSLQIAVPDFRFPALGHLLPDINFQIPALNLPLSTNLLLVLLGASLFLWVVGNFLLLRGSQEALSRADRRIR